MNQEKQILFAGFGGQGVLAMGKFLTHAAIQTGKNVSWLPSYGAEMRGGTANCLVTIADEEISSPLTENPEMA
ncbi:MAG: 2-oxoacid:acceptor oxidoreductase family protein, partial [Syntrophomonadaceae bacterium]